MQRQARDHSLARTARFDTRLVVIPFVLRLRCRNTRAICGAGKALAFNVLLTSLQTAVNLFNVFNQLGGLLLSIAFSIRATELR